MLAWNCRACRCYGACPKRAGAQQHGVPATGIAGICSAEWQCRSCLLFRAVWFRAPAELFPWPPDAHDSRRTGAAVAAARRTDNDRLRRLMAAVHHRSLSLSNRRHAERLAVAADHGQCFVPCGLRAFGHWRGAAGIGVDLFHRRQLLRPGALDHAVRDGRECGVAATCPDLAQCAACSGIDRGSIGGCWAVRAGPALGGIRGRHLFWLGGCRSPRRHSHRDRRH